MNTELKKDVEKIMNWDTQNIYDLEKALRTLYNKIDSPLDEYIDPFDLPTAPIPETLEVIYPIWAMDMNGNCLLSLNFNNHNFKRILNRLEL